MSIYPKSADTIVIGGGTAGAVIAGQLAAQGQAVLLLEAGPDYGTWADKRWPAELSDGRVVAATHSWKFTHNGATGQPDHALERACVLGGCSAHNGCVALWGHRVDYDGWAAAGNPGWSMDEVQPFFAKANAALRVRRFATTEVTPFHAACIEAISQWGIPRVDDLNHVDENLGVNTAPVNLNGTVRWNAAFAYLDPVRNSGQLTVIGDTLVERVQVQNGHVTAVDVVGPSGRDTIAAERVVISAGAYGSPAILFRSGIGSAAELQTLGIQPVVDLPGVGRNLHDHPALYLQFRGTARLINAMETFVTQGNTLFSEQSLAKLRSEQCTSAFDLHIYPVGYRDLSQPSDWSFTVPVANVAPLSRGRVSLANSNPTSRPHIDTGYLTDPAGQDLAVLRSGLAIARQIVRQSPLANLLGEELPTSAVITDDASIRRHCLHYYHPVGTCKMGPATDPLAVVNAQGNVYGTDNLFVADASIMPVIPRANTNLPAAMIGERIAAFLTR